MEDRTGTMSGRGREYGPSRLLFDLWSLFYDNPVIQRCAYRPVHLAVLGRLRVVRPRRVVDIGCGTGQLAAALAGEAWRPQVIGCDFSAGMLRQAARRSRRPRFVRCDVQELPLRSEAAEVVVSTEAFHWFPDQGRVLAEVHRILRPGGVALIAMVTPPSEIISAVTHVGSRALGAPFYWPTAERMRAWAEAAGLRVREQRKIPRLPGAVILPPVLTVLERPRRREGAHAGGRRARRAPGARRSPSRGKG